MAKRRNSGRFRDAGPKSQGRKRGSASNSGSRTALQRHIDFFDSDHDGKITFLETYQGLRRLGLGAARSVVFGGAINAALGSSTSRTPSLTVDADHINAGKHASDTGVYDEKGRFVQRSFDRLFARYDEDGDERERACSRQSGTASKSSTDVPSGPSSAAWAEMSRAAAGRRPSFQSPLKRLPNPRLRQRRKAELSRSFPPVRRGHSGGTAPAVCLSRREARPSRDGKEVRNVTARPLSAGSDTAVSRRSFLQQHYERGTPP
jgi:hypothetical protein